MEVSTWSYHHYSIYAGIFEITTCRVITQLVPYVHLCGRQHLLNLLLAYHVSNYFAQVRHYMLIRPMFAIQIQLTVHTCHFSICESVRCLPSHVFLFIYVLSVNLHQLPKSRTTANFCYFLSSGCSSVSFQTH